jgi:hypothetical protein
MRVRQALYRLRQLQGQSPDPATETSLSQSAEQIVIALSGPFMQRFNQAELALLKGSTSLRAGGLLGAVSKEFNFREEPTPRACCGDDRRLVRSTMVLDRNQGSPGAASHLRQFQNSWQRRPKGGSFGLARSQRGAEMPPQALPRPRERLFGDTSTF